MEKSYLKKDKLAWGTVETTEEDISWVEPTGIITQELAVKSEKKDKEIEGKLERSTLICNEMKLRLTQQENFNSEDSVSIGSPSFDPKKQEHKLKTLWASLILLMVSIWKHKSCQKDVFQTVT